MTRLKKELRRKGVKLERQYYQLSELEKIVGEYNADIVRYYGKMKEEMI